MYSSETMSITIISLQLSQLHFFFSCHYFWKYNILHTSVTSKKILCLYQISPFTFQWSWLVWSQTAGLQLLSLQTFNIRYWAIAPPGGRKMKHQRRKGKEKGKGEYVKITLEEHLCKVSKKGRKTRRFGFNFSQNEKFQKCDGKLL